jgi:hypothetical protein
MARLLAGSFTSLALVMQYRMHGYLSAGLSARTYKNQLQNGPFHSHSDIRTFVSKKKRNENYEQKKKYVLNLFDLFLC